MPTCSFDRCRGVESERFDLRVGEMMLELGVCAPADEDMIWDAYSLLSPA